jgi:hypothetical protein
MVMIRFSGWARRNLPTRESFERIRWLRPVAHRVLLPQLWRFHRRSVPRGVALGVLVGVIVPFGQIVFAALLALPARANVPVAALTTFITNPFTTPPLWIAAYWVGSWMTKVDALTPETRLETHVENKVQTWLQWLLVDAGPTTAVGLLVIAVVGAAVGYLLASFGWRWWTAHKWRHRHARHAHASTAA